MSQTNQNHLEIWMEHHRLALVLMVCKKMVAFQKKTILVVVEEDLEVVEHVSR